MTDMGYLVWTLNPILSVLLAVKDKKRVTKQTSLIFHNCLLHCKVFTINLFQSCNVAWAKNGVVCAFWMEKSTFWIQTNHKKW